MSTSLPRINALAALVLIGFTVTGARAQVPVQGMPIPELADVDSLMQTYMDDNDIRAGVLGFMNNGHIVYQRAFGYKDEALSVPLPESAMMRVASVTKPVTAAATRKLIDWGVIDLDQLVFHLDMDDGGILDYEPWGGELGDERIADITVEHLLRHRGGWNRNAPGVPDLTRMEVVIATAMGFDPYRVPTRRETVEWIMAQELQFAPGTERHYSNVGYLILGLIIEQESGTDWRTFVRTHVLDESMWFPTADFEPGHTFSEDQNPREPWYNNNGLFGTNVFAPNGADVPLPYGSWDHEARVAQGGMITTAVPLLNYLATYYVNEDVNNDIDLIGKPLNGALVNMAHDGRLRGTEALARQTGSGINYVIMLNTRIPVDPPAGGFMYVRELQAAIDSVLNAGTITWPIREVDGIWFDFDYNGPEQGCYDQPYGSIGDLGQVPAYSKVRIKGSSTTWTGVIDRGHIALSAPEGSVVIGQ